MRKKETYMGKKKRKTDTWNCMWRKKDKTAKKPKHFVETYQLI